MFLISLKNNRLIWQIVFVAYLIFSVSCSTSKSVVSQNVDLSKYEYVSVINNNSYHIPAELMEYEILLFDAIEQSKLRLVSDMKIYELSQPQQSKLLLVKYGVNFKEDETIVTVSFIDYETGRPVASCKGIYSTLGIGGASTDIKGAIKGVAEQINKTFGPAI